MGGSVVIFQRQLLGHIKHVSSVFFEFYFFWLMFYLVLAAAVAGDINVSDETGRKARNDPQYITRV